MSSQRVILVTGANRGIGYEAVKFVAQKLPNDVVLLSSRSTANGEAAIKKMQESTPGHSFDNVKVIELDITEKSSLQAAVEKVRSEYGQLTDLVHNTGIAFVGDDYNSPQILEVNVRYARDTIEAFLPLIPRETGRIALVSSEVGAWYTAGTEPSLRAKLDDVSANDWPTIESYVNDWVAFSQNKPDHKLSWPDTSNMLYKAYSASKALVTAWARNFAQSNPDYPIAIVCPGYCATDLNNNSGYRPASQGGESVVWPLFNDYKSGHFYQDGKDLPIAFPMPEGFLDGPKSE